ncbi:MAG: gephyrin-like molybdotransferase Glp [Chloracidobacterium sp.]|uniref:Molybdopterin molybdenumtransferase n=1 Tax=Chloracidobacterium validum TaxID=2821543 RepID=A0ABX8BE69_9BACT|nr:gephyrin-like molybdotransferase Glp [Chloracidobacterium validum]QUW03830.1 molybdopterin molybdotransferase MoeA [Chloracidobacterium validum]
MNPNEKPLSVADAQATALEWITPLGVERVSLLDSIGRVLAETVVAPGDLPPFDNAAMDGYAVIATDTTGASEASPVCLHVIERVTAGQLPDRPLLPGQAIRIMTGAPLPEGASGVVMQEQVRREGDMLTLTRPVLEGDNIRRRGEDVAAGQPVMAVGERLTPAHIGVLAAFHRSFVTVRRRPVVAILATGDELIEVDEPATPGKIVNSNTYALAALVQESGAHPLVLPLARDNQAQVEASFAEAAAAADLIVSSGGVSVGDHDLVKPALENLGLEARFWRVWMKPGKPLLFGRLRGRPCFGLPGNPVSSMVCFHLFVRPALGKMLGLPDVEWRLPEVTARLAGEVKTKGDRPTYLRARLFWTDGEWQAAVLPGQGSGMLTSMLGANGLVFFAEGKQLGRMGEPVPALLLTALTHGQPSFIKKQLIG